MDKIEDLKNKHKPKSLKILIIGSSSELAKDTINELNKRGHKIYSTNRQVDLIEENVQSFHLDVVKELDFIHLKEKFNDLKFDVIINFTGIAVAGAVVELDEKDIKSQLEVNFFGLFRIIKYLSSNLVENGKLVNISSMASYGVFPFLSPYSISKMAADILLNSFSIESNVKTVSIRPGAIATKFWDSSIELNKKIFEKSQTKTPQFEKEKKFLLENAKKNSLHSLNSIYAAKKIADIAEKKNPKPVYNIGLDSKIAKLSRFLPQNIINALIKMTLKNKLSKMD